MKKLSKAILIWCVVALLVLSPMTQMKVMATSITPKETMAVLEVQARLSVEWIIKNGGLLSEKQVTLRVGETHELKVIPGGIARLFGWKIDKVKVGGKEIKLCKVSKNELKVTFKGEKYGETTIEIYMVNSNCLPARTRILTCSVKVGNYPVQSGNSNSGNSNSGNPNPGNPNPGNPNPGNPNPGNPNPGNPNPGNPNPDNPNPGNPNPGNPNPGNPNPGNPNPGNPNPDNPNPGNPNPDNPNPDNPEPELKKLDISNLKFDPKSLSIVYDGKPHLPALVGVPDEVDVEVIWKSKPAINAGIDYEATVSFKVPEGYEAIPDMTTKYSIEKSEVKTNINFDKETGKIVVSFDGIATEDISSDTAMSWVNGETFTDEYLVTEPGCYVTTTNITVDSGKEDNYTGLESLETVFNVKREQAWYRLSTNVTQEDDKVILEVYISDIKVQQGNAISILALGFDVDYDKSVLEQDFSGGDPDDEFSGIAVSGDGWDGYYWAERRDNTAPDEDSRDAVLTFADVGPLTGNSLVCTITYNVLTDENGELKNTENLQFTVKNATLAPEGIVNEEEGEELDNPFEYTTDAETIIFNPSETTANEETVYIEYDIMGDANYMGDEDDEEYYAEKLKEYIDSGFQVEENIQVQSELGFETEPKSKPEPDADSKHEPELEPEPEIESESELDANSNGETDCYIC